MKHNWVGLEPNFNLLHGCTIWGFVGGINLGQSYPRGPASNFKANSGTSIAYSSTDQFVISRPKIRSARLFRMNLALREDPFFRLTKTSLLTNSAVQTFCQTKFQAANVVERLLWINGSDYFLTPPPPSLPLSKCSGGDALLSQCTSQLSLQHPCLVQPFYAPRLNLAKLHSPSLPFTTLNQTQNKWSSKLYSTEFNTFTR